MQEEKKYAKNLAIGDLALIAGCWECVHDTYSHAPGKVTVYTASGDWTYLDYSTVLVLPL